MSEIWPHSAEVRFVYPQGEEHGFDAAEKHGFEGVMGGMFSAGDLKVYDVRVHTDGKDERRFR